MDLDGEIDIVIIDKDGNCEGEVQERAPTKAAIDVEEQEAGAGRDVDENSDIEADERVDDDNGKDADDDQPIVNDDQEIDNDDQVIDDNDQAIDNDEQVIDNDEPVIDNVEVVENHFAEQDDSDDLKQSPEDDNLNTEDQAEAEEDNVSNNGAAEEDREDSKTPSDNDEEKDVGNAAIGGSNFFDKEVDIVSLDDNDKDNESETAEEDQREESLVNQESDMFNKPVEIVSLEEESENDAQEKETAQEDKPQPCRKRYGLDKTVHDADEEDKENTNSSKHTAMTKSADRDQDENNEGHSGDGHVHKIVSSLKARSEENSGPHGAPEIASPSVKSSIARFGSPVVKKVRFLTLKS